MRLYLRKLTEPIRAFGRTILSTTYGRMLACAALAYARPPHLLPYIVLRAMLSVLRELTGLESMTLSVSLMLLMAIVYLRPSTYRPSLAQLLEAGFVIRLMLSGGVLLACAWLLILVPAPWRWIFSTCQLAVVSWPAIAVALWIFDAPLRPSSMGLAVLQALRVAITSLPMMLVLTHVMGTLPLWLCTSVFEKIVSAEGALYLSCLLVIPWYVTCMVQWYISMRYGDELA